MGDPEEYSQEEIRMKDKIQELEMRIMQLEANQKKVSTVLDEMDELVRIYYLK